MKILNVTFRNVLLLIGLIFFFVGCKEEQKRIQSPNIIYIMADDLGYGDLSCFGQKRFSTPNIDKLAAEGMMFTQHYSGSTVCAPSRCTLMTGKHTGNAYIRGNNAVESKVDYPMRGDYPLDGDEITIAELLKTKEYVTGLFGKWGLGYSDSEGDPINQGFDEFFGYLNQGLAHHYYPYHLWENDQKFILEGNKDKNTNQYTPELIYQKAIDFIEANKDTTFFLYYPSIIPHAELFAPEKYMALYRGKFLPEKEYQGCDNGPNYRKALYGSQKEGHAAFVAIIHVLDDQVGEIVAKVKTLGLEDNTIIIFTSDNGPHQEGGADPDYFDSNSIYRGYKRDLYEGGIRVPMIVKWPGKIKPGTKSDHISAFWDILPTMADISGTGIPENIDGISFLPTLMGMDQPNHEYLYWEFNELNGRRAIRKDNWKVVVYDVKSENPKPAELYDLSVDPSEENNMAEKHPKILEEILSLINNRSPSHLDDWNF